MDSAVALFDADRLRFAVGADDLAERPVGRRDEREAREAGLGARAVKPDCVFAVAVALLENGLRLAPLAEPQVVNGDFRTLARRGWRW